MLGTGKHLRLSYLLAEFMLFIFDFASLSSITFTELNNLKRKKFFFKIESRYFCSLSSSSSRAKNRVERVEFVFEALLIISRSLL